MTTAVNGGKTLIGQAIRTHTDYRGTGIWVLLREEEAKFLRKKFPDAVERCSVTNNWKRVPSLQPNRHMWNIRATGVGDILIHSMLLKPKMNFNCA